jgi:quercetin dioxygenase-like cupin family protein
MALHEMGPIEGFEDRSTGAQFFIAYSGSDFTTGITKLPPSQRLPEHSRPAIENLVQIAGRALVILSTAAGTKIERALEPGDSLIIPAGVPHVHANPYDELSVTLFRADGDTTAAVDALRQHCQSIVLPVD